MAEITFDNLLYSADPVNSFNFVLRVEGVFDIPLRSVRAFTKNNNYEKIREGGLNDYVHMKRMPIQDIFSFQVERYISNSLTDPLANGAILTLPVILKIQKSTYNKTYGSRNSLTDTSDALSKASAVLDETGTDCARIYVFTGCVVMGKEYGELNAERSGLATEVVTIGYKELFVLPNIAALGGEDTGFGVR